MADSIFIQRSWISRQLYQLNDEQLLITGGHLGQTVTHEFPLRTISADYRRGGWRNTTLIVVSFLGATLCLGLTVLSLQMEEGPEMLAGYPATFGLGFLATALRAVRRFDCFIFSNHWNQPLFIVIRDPSQSEEFDTFINDLLDRLERVGQGQPPEAIAPATALSPPPSAVTLPSAEDPGEAKNAVPRWRLSIGAGTAAAIYPWVAKMIPELGHLVLLFPIVFACSVLASWWCLQSHLNKEVPRHWALLGLALAWLPWVVY